MIDVTPQMVELTVTRGRTKVGGRVLPKVSGESFTLRDPGHNLALQFFAFGDLKNLKEYPSTHDRDKALLIKLGVDGNVPLAQARRNAGLDTDDGGFLMPKWASDWVFAELANDNHEIRAADAA